MNKLKKAVVAAFICVLVLLLSTAMFVFADSGAENMLICEKFENDNSDYYLRSSRIVTDDAIGDNGSLLCKSSEAWNDFVTFKRKIDPDKTYTVAFRYNFIGVTDGAFAYVNIKSNSNVDDASYLGFDGNGAVASFGANYIGASFDKGFYRTTAFVTFTVGSASDYTLVFGAKGTVCYMLDDVTLTEGGEPSFADSMFAPHDELTFDEDFEGGYGVFDGIDDNFLPQGKLGYNQDDVIDGSYSVCAKSDDDTVVWLCGSGKNVSLAQNSVYTLLLRTRTDGKAKLCMAVVSDKHGQKSTLANFDEQGRLYSDMSYNVASYITKVADGYSETRIIFTTPEQGNLQLRIGVRGGKMSVDNVRLYKNAADVCFGDEPSFAGGGAELPMLSLPEAEKPTAQVIFDRGNAVGTAKVVFDEFVLPSAKMSQAVTLKIDNRRADCETTFEIDSRTLTVTWDSVSSKYKYVTLLIADNAFVNADELGNEKTEVTFFNGSDDVKAFVDAWEQVQYGDEQTRKAATKTALGAYDELSDKEYFAEAYAQVKKLSDWYAQQDKPNDELSDDKPQPDKNGCLSVVDAVGGTALLLTAGAVSVVCGKRKESD